MYCQGVELVLLASHIAVNFAILPCSIFHHHHSWRGRGIKHDVDLAYDAVGLANGT